MSGSLTTKSRTTSQRSIVLKIPPTQRATFIPSIIDEKFKNFQGGFAVAITS
jgi:hypothetical protein